MPDPFRIFRHPVTGRISAPRVAVAATATWMAIAVPFVGNWEGFAAKPYVDRVGTGHPVTWCYGETAADGSAVPPMNKIYTKAECTDSLKKKLIQYNAEIKGPRCIHVPMKPNVEAAMTSAAYNLGPRTVCKYLAPDINSGNVAGACNKLPEFNHASGVVNKGLVNRRAAERALCLE